MKQWKRCLLLGNYVLLTVYVLLLFDKYGAYQTFCQGLFIYAYVAAAGLIVLHFCMPLLLQYIREKRKGALFGFLLAMAVVFLCREQLTIGIPRDNRLCITALGEKNQASKGAEVWITCLKVNGKKVALHDLKISGGWVYRTEEQAIVAYPDGSANTMEVDLGKADQIELQLVKHQWSGKAEWRINDQDLIKADLFSSLEGDRYTCIMEGDFYQNRFLDFWSYAMAVELCFFGICMLVCFSEKKKGLRALYGMLFTMFLSASGQFLSVSGCMLLVLSAGYGGIAYYGSFLKNRIVQKNKGLFLVLSAISAFQLFGAKLFLISKDYSLRTWVYFLLLVLWTAPLVNGAVRLLAKLEQCMKKKQEHAVSLSMGKRRERIARVGIVVAGIVFGVMVGCAAMEIFSKAKQDYTVTITPTGEKNKNAQGYEVLLGSVLVDGKACDQALFADLPAGWKKADGLIKGTGTHGLTLHFESANDIKLVFNKHEWSGKVRITDNGKVTYLDLYAGRSSASYLTTYQVKGKGQNKWTWQAPLVFVWGGVSAAVSLLAVCVLRCLTQIWYQETDARNFFWTVLLSELLIYSVFILASYPASICIDGRTQLLQALGYEKLTDAHPAIHTLLLRLLTMNGKCIVLFPVFQMLLISLINATVLKNLYCKGIHPKVLILCGIGFPLMVNHGIYVTVLWKDELYSICLLALVCILYRVEKEKLYMGNIWHMLLTALVLAAVRLMRHNGILVFLLAAVLFTGLSIVRKSGKYVLCIGITVLFITLIRGPVYHFAGVQDKSSGTSSASMLHGIVYAAVVDDVPKETKTFLTKLMPMDVWIENYQTYSANALFQSKSAKKYGISARMDEIGTGKLLKEYCRVLLACPLRLIEERLFGTDLLWNVVQDNGYNWRVANDIYEVGVVENTMGFYRHDNLFTVLVRKAAAASMDIPALDLIFWRAGFWLWVLLIFFYYSYIRKKHIWMFSVPMVANMASLGLAMVWQDFRYVYFLNMCVPWLALLCLAENSAADEEGKIEDSNHYPGLQ